MGVTVDAPTPMHWIWTTYDAEGGILYFLLKGRRKGQTDYGEKGEVREKASEMESS